MNQKPAFRFGVNSSPRDASSTAELARKLEANGFHVLLTPDGPSHGAAVFPLLSFAAAATSTLHVGTYVAANDLHHTFELAHNTATLQTLSGGRFELGIGAGRPGMEAEYAQIGRSIDAPGVRLARLRESAATIRQLLRGETVRGVSGIEEATLPGWLTAGSPSPVMIAGAGPKLLDMATETADIVAVGAAPFDTWSALRGKFDRIGELSRQREIPVEVNMTLSGAGNMLAGWFARMPQEQRDNLLKAEAPALLWGDVDAMIEGIHQRYEQFGVSYFVVPDDLVDTLSPVVKQLAS